MELRNRRNIIPQRSPHIQSESPSFIWSNLVPEIHRGIEHAYIDQENTRKNAYIEIEIQFGTYIPPKETQKYGKFKSFVSPAAFNRVMTMMKSEVRQFTEETIEDQIDGDERKAINKTTNETTHYDKVKVWSSYVFFNPKEKKMNSRITTNGKYFAEELNSRVNVSNEYIYRNPSRNFKPNTIRNKHRTSFVFEDIGKLDLTQATETATETSIDDNDEKKSFGTTYEIELELSKKDIDRNISKIQKFCEYIYSLIQDSEIPYTNTEKSNMYKYVSSLLKIDSGILRYNLLAEARDLKLEDMTYGGIVGNPQTQYAVTHKADGIRRLLVFTPTEVWMFMPGLPDANLLYRIDSHRSCPYKNGFIFDGELLTMENRKDNHSCKYIYYIFDCLCQDKNDIRQIKDYMKRIQHALSFTRTRIDSNALNQTIDIRVKHSKIIPNVDKFFEVMKSMFEDQNLLNYNQDGFMFIPINSEYNPYDENSKNIVPIYSRTLKHHPDICKWKPKDMRSIDFLVEIRQTTPTEKKIILNAIDIDPTTNERQMRPFVGTDNHPLGDRIDIHHSILENLLDRTIVEFYWDETKNLLTPIRIRDDKVSPNRYFSALNIWKGIFSGIDPETLIGNSFQLMRSYHNQLKLDLYKNTHPSRNHKVLLDIGSGRGGDIKKWSDFELVFAVEPNPSHIKELEKRLEKSAMMNKVVIIPTGGEDYQKITETIQRKYGERVTTVSLMLSFSFFHGPIRDGLRKTIQQNLEIGGEVLIFTIDGDVVKKVFEDRCATDNCLRFLDAQTKYEPETGKLWIDIPSTIVSQQEEIPPKLSELFEDWKNFMPMEMKCANEQPFLNKDEKSFSEMFKSFKMILVDKENEEIISYQNFDDKEWYGISIYPSDKFFLSAVLKAVEPEYQNDTRFSFRREYENKTWNEIQKYISDEEKQKYPSLSNENILELLSDIYEVKILYIKDAETKTYGTNENKIIINGKYIMATKNQDELLQTIF
jgi:hypothetical protein